MASTMPNRVGRTCSSSFSGLLTVPARKKPQVCSLKEGGNPTVTGSDGSKPDNRPSMSGQPARPRQQGMKEGDVITGVNEHKVGSVSELQEWVARNRPGTSINVSYRREGKDKQAK